MMVMGDTASRPGKILKLGKSNSDAFFGNTFVGTTVYQPAGISRSLQLDGPNCFSIIEITGVQVENNIHIDTNFRFHFSKKYAVAMDFLLSKWPLHNHNLIENPDPTVNTLIYTANLDISESQLQIGELMQKQKMLLQCLVKLFDALEASKKLDAPKTTLSCPEKIADIADPIQTLLGTPYFESNFISQISLLS